MGEALARRYSCRCFSDRPVEQEVLAQVLSEAMHTLSCENSQPWEIYVAGPEAMDRLRQAVEADRKSKMPQDLNRRFDGAWTTEVAHRVDDYFDGLLAHEPKGNFDYTMQKRALFYAPVMVFLCLEQGLPTWSVFDTGMFAQSMMLSAAAHGLDTMASAVSVAYPDAVRRVLGIPADRWAVIGIGVGYAQGDAAINTYRTARKGQEAIHWTA